MSTQKTQIDDGGPIAPNISNTTSSVSESGERHVHTTVMLASGGLSIRDYFAAAALTAAANKVAGGAVHVADMVAEDCYAYADAMLKVRGGLV